MSVEAKLLDRVQRVESGCWEWTGAVTNKGYGKINVGGKTTRAHRVAYGIFCGAVEFGVYVCHRCDNRLCCNPTHLFSGTAIDNNRDMYAKGRGSDRRGEKHGQSKLTAETVRQMRSLRQEGRSYRQLSAMFGVSTTQARRAVLGNQWKHV